MQTSESTALIHYTFDEFGQLESAWSESSRAKKAYRITTWLVGLIPLAVLVHTFWQGKPGGWDWVELFAESVLLLSWLGLRLGLTQGWNHLILTSTELRYMRGWWQRHRFDLSQYASFQVERPPYLKQEWVFRRPGQTLRLPRPAQYFAEDRARLDQVEEALQSHFS